MARQALKSEIRMSNIEPNSNDGKLEIVSDFGFRVSDLNTI